MSVKTLFCFVICCLPACATTYYVANAGNDSNAGTSSAAPWQTVAKVNSSYFAPGDSILFKRGDIFREQLMPPTSGAPGNQITYSAYGIGPNPVVSGADLISQWQGGSTSGSNTTGCASACLFSSSMESGNFVDWTSVYSPSLDGTSVTQSTSIVHSGKNSVQIKAGLVDNRGGLTEAFSPFGSEGIRYFRFYMYVPVGALRPHDNFIIFQIPQGSTNLSLYTDGNGNVNGLQYYANGGSIAPVSGISFWMGTWNRFDVAFKSGSSDGGGQVWLNGNSIGSNYSLNTSSSAGVNSVLLGNDSYGHGQEPGASIYFDDFAIATTGPIGSIVASTPPVTTNPSNGIWTAALATQPNVVFIAGNLGVHMASSAQVTAPGQWSWNQGTLSVYSASGAPSNVEAAQRSYGLLLGQNAYGNYITVSGIDFRLANADVVHIVNTTGDILNDGLITGSHQYGVLALGVSGRTVSNLQITNNTVSMNESSGIEISSGHTNVTVQGNTVFGNAFNPTYAGDYIEMGGINFLSNPGVATYDVVSNNVSDNNGVYNGNESEGSGIWFDTNNNSIMQNNVSFNNAAYGLYFEKTENSSMLNNVAYSNGYVPYSANIAAYASQGLPSFGNTISGNTAWGSHNWGLKIGAYQGNGATSVYNNAYTNNVILTSQDLDLYADTGADNDGVNGYGNVYSGNGFGLPTPSRWLYWVTYGFMANYSQFDAAYGSSTNSVQSNWALPIGGQERCVGSCVFSSGMESGSFSDWSSVYRPASDSTLVTQSNSMVNSGLHSLQITGGGTDNRGGLSVSFPAFGSEGTKYFRFYMYAPVGGLKANDTFIVFELPAGGSNITLGTDAHGNITTLNFAAAASIGSIISAAPIPFAMGTWNYFDVAFKAGGGDGGGQVWLNGVYVGGNFGLNTSASAGVGSVLIGNDSYGHGQVPGGNIYFDDFKISTVGPIGAAPITLPLPQ